MPMKLTGTDSLRATFWGLVIIWGFGGAGLLVFTEKPLFAVVYLVTLGPILALIYHTAKTEWMEHESKKKNPPKKNV